MNRDFPPSDNKHPNAAESIVTSRHVELTIREIELEINEAIDPLDCAPAIQEAAIVSCKENYLWMLAQGVPEREAARAASYAYLAAAMVGRSMRKAVRGTILGE